MIKATITKDDGSIDRMTFDDFKALSKWIAKNHGAYTGIQAYREKETADITEGQHDAGRVSGAC